LDLIREADEIGRVAFAIRCELATVLTRLDVVGKEATDPSWPDAFDAATEAHRHVRRLCQTLDALATFGGGA
jgi:hypothetical protein